MFKKKAQAAMEFLMTYGWAILVVLVAIGALAYFGVLSPDRFLPERCTGPSGLDCLDKASITATNGQVQFVFKNNLGFPIFIGGGTETATEDCSIQSTPTFAVDSGTGFGTDANQHSVPNGDMVRITLDCSAGNLDGRFKTDVTIPYVNNETGLTHQAAFSLTGVAG